MEPVPDPRQRIRRELDSGRVAIGSDRYWQLIEALENSEQQIPFLPTPQLPPIQR